MKVIKVDQSMKEDMGRLFKYNGNLVTPVWHIDPDTGERSYAIAIIGGFLDTENGI